LAFNADGSDYQQAPSTMAANLVLGLPSNHNHAFKVSIVFESQQTGQANAVELVVF